jgi:hypothetical protein
VDNTDASANDTQGCGVPPAAPCRTIGYGVAQALARVTSSAGYPTVRVQGGGDPYLGECSNSTAGNFLQDDDGDPPPPQDFCGRGIMVDPPRSLAVVGLNVSRGSGASVGAPVIDCEGLGRAFTFGKGYWGRIGKGEHDDDDKIPEAEAQLVLEGLVVRNGRACNPVLGYEDASGLDSGGAVWASAPLVLRYCVFEGCQCTSSSGFGSGGAVYVKNAHLNAEGSDFEDCSTTRALGANQSSVGGGAVSVSCLKSDVAVVLSSCRFENTSCDIANANANGGGNGGGAVLLFADSSLNYNEGGANFTATIANSTFTGCSAGIGDGGAVALTYGGTLSASFLDGSMYVTGSTFSACTAGGVGGALALRAQVSGTSGISLVVDSSRFGGNVAGGATSSGGAVSVLFPEEEPQNRKFKGVPTTAGLPGPPMPDLNNPCSGCGSFPSCEGCPHFLFCNDCVIPLEHEFRRWDHAASKNTFTLRDSRFFGNSAGLSGGALAAPIGGAGVIDGCRFDDNSAKTLFGGGSYVGGTVQLRVSRSIWRGNECGQGGCQIYSSSGAGIDFKLNSSVELGCVGSSSGNCHEGVSAVQSGNWTWDASSGMSCAPGYELASNSKSAYNVTFDDWRLEPPVADLGCIPSPDDDQPQSCGIVDNVTNCPCYFSFVPIWSMHSSNRPTPPLEMLVSALSYTCSPCATGLYSLVTPTAGGSAPVNATCTVCPFGGDCSGIELKPKGGYFGTRVADTHVVFSLCPAGYCVGGNGSDSDGAKIATYAQCAAGSHRDWTVPLCGGCRPGYAQSISTANCIENGACPSTALWFWPAALLYCLAYAIYFLWSTPDGNQQAELKAELPSNQLKKRFAAMKDKLEGSSVIVALKSGGIPVLMFFYQMAGVVVPLKGVTAEVSAQLKSFFGMQVGSSTSSSKQVGGYCIWAGMTSLAKIEMHYAIPIAMAIVLATVAKFGPKRLAARFPCALAQLLLVAYATLTTTTLQLLSCTTMPGDGGKRVLFLAGATECGGWQAPLYLLMIALVAIPAVPLLVFGARHMPPHWWLAQKARVAQFPAQPTAQALRSSLTKAFSDEYWHWPALLALQRLLMVAIPIFITNVLQSSLALAFVTFFMQNLQLSFTPYANADVNKLQKLASDCLLALAMLNIPQRSLQQASVDVDSPTELPLNRVCDRLDDVMALFLLAPLLLPVLVVVGKSLAQALGLTQRARVGGGGSFPNAEPLLSHQFVPPPMQQQQQQQQGGILSLEPTNSSDMCMLRTGNVLKYAVGQYVQNMGMSGVSGHIVSLAADAGSTGPGTMTIKRERQATAAVKEMSMRTSNILKYSIGQRVDNMGASSFSGHIVTVVADQGTSGPGSLTIRSGR